MKHYSYVLTGIILFTSAILGDSPSLPMGLSGLSMSEETEVKKSLLDTIPIEFSGFSDTRVGTRLQDDATEKQTSLSETRLHLAGLYQGDAIETSVAADLLYDPTYPDTINLNTGKGSLDIREASVFFSPGSHSDIKIGRQILTWGTGDLLFINDLFPKDWNSFFLGRDQDYLKAPSDAFKGSFYFPHVNVDVVYTPQFDSDRYIDGTRISYYNGNVGRIAGRDTPLSIDTRQKWFSEDEVSIRLHRLVGSMETAIYAYNGYWKSPKGQNSSGVLQFNALSVYGASLRSPFRSGIGSIECGLYDSQDDKNGTNPMIPNSQFRFLVGYEQELRPQFIGNFQYYLEHMLDHDNYLSTLPTGAIAEDKDRHVFTVRLTKFLKQERWKLSGFNYYSPSDKDGYLRLNVSHIVSDELTLEAGSNLFYGQHDYTFFGQFQNNTNIYTAVHFSFL